MTEASFQPSVPEHKDIDENWGILWTITIGMLGYAASIVVSLLIAMLAFSLFGRSIQEDLTFSFVILVFSDSAFLAVILAFLIPKGSMKKRLGLVRARLSKYLYLIPASAGYVITTAALTATIAILLPDLNLDQPQELPFVNAEAVPELIIAAVALLVVAPITEEIVFRGFIFRGFRNKFGFIGAAFISSIIFGIAHGQINVAIDTFALGLFLCYVYEKTGSLWVSVALHALKNGIAFYLLFFTEIALI